MSDFWRPPVLHPPRRAVRRPAMDTFRTVTHVERQPFRSMGFVSVIIVSALFALGLPLVLL